eukprot:8698-Eustigmatos_ZCMA.PRE.1
MDRPGATRRCEFEELQSWHHVAFMRGHPHSDPTILIDTASLRLSYTPQHLLCQHSATRGAACPPTRRSSGTPPGCLK